jgi:hypothetical protein
MRKYQMQRSEASVDSGVAESDSPDEPQTS